MRTVTEFTKLPYVTLCEKPYSMYPIKHNEPRVPVHLHNDFYILQKKVLYIRYGKLSFFSRESSHVIQFHLKV